MNATEIINEALSVEPINPYICYGCGWKSSVERTKPGEFLCNECLKVWEGGKFYPHSESNKS